MNMMIEKLVLGTVQLGLPYGINNATGQPDKQQAFDILHTALEAGVRMLDTADAYGTATQIIGEYHRERETPSEKFRIITKFHFDATTNLEQKAHETLTNLNVSSLYCYQFHRCSDLQVFPEAQSHLLRLKEQGIINKVGISIYTNDEFAEAIASDIIDVIQFPFNLLDNTRLRGELIAEAARRGKELHTRSVFLQGLFFRDAQSFPERLAPLALHVEQLQNLAKNRNLPISTLALNYVLHNPAIQHVLFGVETVQQLRETLAAVQGSFDEALRREIESIVVETPELLSPVNWS